MSCGEASDFRLGAASEISAALGVRNSSSGLGATASEQREARCELRSGRLDLVTLNGIDSNFCRTNCRQARATLPVPHSLLAYAGRLARSRNVRPSLAAPGRRPGPSSRVPTGYCCKTPDGYSVLDTPPAAACRLPPSLRTVADPFAGVASVPERRRDPASQASCLRSYPDCPAGLRLPDRVFC